VPKRINLVPKSERVRTATNVPALALIAGGILVVFSLALSYYLLNNQRNSLREELSGLEDQRASLEQQVRALDSYKELAAQVATMEETVRGVYAGRTLVYDVLSDISRALPENVWLTTMSLSLGEPQQVSNAEDENNGKIVSGVGSLSIQGNTYSFPDVSALLVRLKLVPSLREITLGSAGNPVGNVDPSKHVRGFSMTTAVVNTQEPDTALPMSKVEVEGL